MNVLNLIKSVCYEINISAPALLVGSTDPATKQLLNQMYAVARELRDLRTFPQLKKKGRITLVSGRTKYPLPEDYYAALLGTQWDEDRRWRLIGPMSDSSFTNRLFGYDRTSTQIGYRIFGPDMNPNTLGGQFEINPTPGTTTDELPYEYIMKTMFFPPNWTPLTAIGLGAYRNANGIIYICTTGGTTSSTPPETIGTAITDGTVIWASVSAPYEEIISDQDFCLFDDSIMIPGIKYKWYQAKGLDWKDFADEAKVKFDQAVGRWGGSFRGSLNKGFGARGLRYYPPGQGGWSF